MLALYAKLVSASDMGAQLNLYILKALSMTVREAASETWLLKSIQKPDFSPDK